jgi:hypothetical protein
VCGGKHAACGPPSTSIPVDENWEVATVAGPLKEYEVTLPGGRTTTMKLNERDAERYGVLEGTSSEQQKTSETQTEDASAKARTTRNKARTTASDKGDG